MKRRTQSSAKYRLCGNFTAIPTNGDLQLGENFATMTPAAAYLRSSNLRTVRCYIVTRFVTQHNKVSC
jgi:hypothetical protein